MFFSPASENWPWAPATSVSLRRVASSLSESLMSVISPLAFSLEVNSAPTSILNSGPATLAASPASFESNENLPNGDVALVLIRSIVWTTVAEPEASTSFTVQLMSMIRPIVCFSSRPEGSWPVETVVCSNE